MRLVRLKPEDVRSRLKLTALEAKVIALVASRYGNPVDRDDISFLLGSTRSASRLVNRLADRKHLQHRGVSAYSVALTDETAKALEPLLFPEGKF